MSKNDGGPAFPRGAETGMTLRDWYAGQVLVGALSGANGLGDLPTETRAELFQGVAGIVYEIADAMLAARAKP